MERATAFLQRVGSIHHFQQQGGRGKIDWVVIDPSFLIDMMKCIVSLQNIIIQDGHFTKEDVPKIFHALCAANPVLCKNLTPEGMCLLSFPNNSLKCCCRALFFQPEGAGAIWFGISIATRTIHCPMDAACMWVTHHSRLSGLFSSILQKICFCDSSYQHAYDRYWTFQFLPQGFFSHLIVRMLQQPHLQVLEYWKNAVKIRKEISVVTLQIVDMTSTKHAALTRNVLSLQVWLLFLIN